MQAFGFDFAQTGALSPLMLDYLQDDSRLNAFHSGLPSQQRLVEQAQIKQKHYPSSHRKVLTSVLQKQYAGLDVHPKVRANLDKLQDPSTLTLCTGHQLSLMTGPLYFIYKILTIIKLADELNAQKTGCYYVPVFWMASEDHDFDEISAFQSQGKKFQWNQDQGGAVGKIPLEELQKVLDLWEKEGLMGPYAPKIQDWIENSYRQAKTLAEATFVLVHQIFQEYGLVILDADNAALKQLFVPYMQQELEQQTTFETVGSQIQALKENYSESFKPQVNPREINLFYLEAGSRKRIVTTENGLALEDNRLDRSLGEWLAAISQTPEQFSPNVLMRPLYQECILPNIAYIGGGGELAYWLQLQSNFTAFKMPFPLLLLRQSALLFTSKSQRKWQQLGLELKDVFLKRNALINKKIRLISNIDLDFDPLKSVLDEQFTYLESLVSETDASFEGALNAQKRKQIKGLEHLEKRLIQAQRKKLKDHVSRLVLAHETFFPGGKLQERTLNFMDFYGVEGFALLDFLYQNFTPLTPKMLAVELS